MVNNQPGFLSFAKSTVIFFVGSTLSKVITLLLLPLYTRNLPTADYGYFDLSVTYVTLLTAFLYCDIWSSVMRFMRDDLTGEAPKRIVAGGWVLFALSTIVYYAIGMVASLFINIPNIGYILAYGTFFNLISMFSYISRGWEHNITGLKFGPEYYEWLKDLYTEKRDYLCGRLEQMGLPHTTPQGSYFVLVDISGFLERPEFSGWTDLEFCEWMIKKYGVAAVPGSSFFKEPVNNYIRLHFSRGKETLKMAADRLEKMAKDYGFC